MLKNRWFKYDFNNQTVQKRWFLEKRLMVQQNRSPNKRCLTKKKQMIQKQDISKIDGTKLDSSTKIHGSTTKLFKNIDG